MNALQPKTWLELSSDDFVSTIKRLKPETLPAEGLCDDTVGREDEYRSDEAMPTRNSSGGKSVSCVMAK
jgi:hypothetical protein